MSDRYIDFANSSIGHRLVGALGLPSPVRLERWQAGRLRPVEGALLIGGGPLADKVSAFANRLTDAIYSYGTEPSMATAWIPGHGPKLKAVVFDASDLVQTDQLKQLREFFQPLMKNLDHSAHVVILGRDPQTLQRSVRRQCPARPRRLQPLAGQGTAQRWHLAVDPCRRRCRRSTGRPVAVFPLAEKRLRVRASHSPECLRHPGDRTGLARWPGARHWSPALRAASAPPSPKPWPVTAPRSSCSTCHRPKPISKPSPHASAGAASPSTSAPKTPPRSWSNSCPTASTSWCTTPASPGTKPWPT